MKEGAAYNKLTAGKSFVPWATCPAEAIGEGGRRTKPIMWAKPPCFTLLKMQNKANYRIFSSKKTVAQKTKPNVGEASLLRCPSARPEGTSLFLLF
jgi:hypothetical protein